MARVGRRFASGENQSAGGMVVQVFAAWRVRDVNRLQTMLDNGTFVLAEHTKDSNRASYAADIGIACKQCCYNRNQWRQEKRCVCHGVEVVGSDTAGEGSV